METKPIDPNDLRLNPAKWPAIGHAAYRARRENKPMNVYVGPPGSKHGFTFTGCNVWTVKPEGEAAPDGATLFRTEYPFGELSALENGSRA